jgi:hypothetical protein
MGLFVTYKKGFGLDDWIYCNLYIHNSGLQAIQRYRWSTHFNFIITHALGFSILTSRVLATDSVTVSLSLQITHEVSLLQPNFFSTILQLPIPKTWLKSNSLLPSSYPGRLVSRNSTLHFRLLFCSVLFCWTLPYNHFARTTPKTQSLLLRRCVYWSVA